MIGDDVAAAVADDDVVDDAGIAESIAAADATPSEPTESIE